MSNPVKKIEELIDDRDKKHIDFTKYLILLASSLFGILIALNKPYVGSFYTNLSFAVALLLLALGILCGGISLYAHVYASRTLFEKYREAVIEQLRERSENTKPVFVNPPKIFPICEIMCYVSLFLSVVVLCLYVILSSF